jgi:Flp pilus assembly protein TadD
MGVTRILDLIVLLLLATIILMPRPDATVKPALAVDPELRARVAELQSGLIGHPEDADAAVELANIYLDGHRPDWALATVGAAERFHPNDYRLYHLRAIAFADRFEGEPASDAAARALSLCLQTPTPPGGVACGPAAQSRLSLLASTLAAVAKVDMKKQPYLAKDRIFEQLHPTFIPKPRTKPAQPSPTSPAAPHAKTPPAP